MKNRSKEQVGLIAWLENTRVVLPLKGVECRFNVTGSLASVELSQVYHQDNSQPLDCVYQFPMPAGAAIHRCEVHIGERTISAKVKPDREAKRLYKESKKRGHRAALVEMERENLFTLSLGNIQPGDLVVVCLEWFILLDRLGRNLRLLVPTCPGIRYIPGNPLLRSPSGRGTADDTDQVPDASRISPPRMDALHPDAAYFCVQGRVESAGIENLSSPTHPIAVREEADAFSVELVDRGVVPDGDFVLSWNLADSQEVRPQAWSWTHNGETFALLELRAPEHAPATGERDYYFLIDRSGSMAGAKWNATLMALNQFLQLLGDNDRVWLTFFSQDFQDFSDCPVPAAQVLRDRKRLEKLDASGGTQLLPAAEHLLGKIKTHSSGRNACVVLITDGEVGNEAEILAAFKKAGEVTVHTFGIDTSVNDAFLKQLARQTRGACWLQTPDDDIAGTIAALAGRLRRPVVSGLAVEGDWELPAGLCPDLHAGEVVMLLLKAKRWSPMSVRGRLPEGSPWQVVCQTARTGTEAIGLLWSRERIDCLLALGDERAAIALAVARNLLCKGTAFVAWDDAEKVQIARTELIQPAMDPGIKHANNPYSSRRRIAEPPELEARMSLLVEHRRLEKEERLRQAQKEHDLLEHAAHLIEAINRRCRVPGVGQRLLFELEHAKGSPWALERWMVRADQLRARLFFLEDKLRDLMPDAVLHRVIQWICESDDIDESRFDRTRAFIDMLRSMPETQHRECSRGFLGHLLRADESFEGVWLESRK